MADRLLYTPEQAAEVLGVSRRTVYRMIAAGEFERLADVKRAGAQKTRTRIRHDDLMRLIDHRTRTTA